MPVTPFPPGCGGRCRARRARRSRRTGGRRGWSGRPARRRRRAAAGEQDEPRPGGAQGRDRLGGALGVERVGGAEHRHRRRGRVVGGEHVVDALGGAGLDGVDPPGAQQVPGEPRSRGVGRERPERGQERGGTGAVARGVRVGAVAQRLVGSGRPVQRQAAARTVRHRLAVERTLVEVGELADAGDRRGAGGDVALPLARGRSRRRRRRRRCRGRPPRRPRARPAGRSPTPPAARSSVSFSTAYEPPAGSTTLRDVRLLHQQDLGVAGDPSRERLRRTDCRVERRDGDRVGAADAGREGGHRAAEHVDPRVAAGEQRLRQHGVLALRHLGGAAGVEHAGPGAAGGAQQRDGRQLLHRDAVPELEQAGRRGDVEAGVDERPQVRDARGEREAELLGVRAAGVAHRGGVDGDGGEPRVRRRDPDGEGDDVRRSRRPPRRRRRGRGPRSGRARASRAGRRRRSRGRPRARGTPRPPPRRADRRRAPPARGRAGRRRGRPAGPRPPHRPRPPPARSR